MKRPSYQETLQAMVFSGAIKPGVTVIEIKHNDDCPELRGTGECDCEYEIEVGGTV